MRRISQNYRFQLITKKTITTEKIAIRGGNRSIKDLWYKKFMSLSRLREHTACKQCCQKKKKSLELNVKRQS